MEQYFHKGDKVFAKMRGYHTWPARVEAIVKISTSPAKALYKVFFYGTHQTGYCKAQNLLDFAKNKDKLGHHGKSFSFYDAMVEIEEDPDVTHVPSPEPENEAKKVNKNKLVKRKPSSSENGDKKQQFEPKKKKQDESIDEDGNIRVIITRAQIDNLLALDDTPPSLKEKLKKLISS